MHAMVSLTAATLVSLVLLAVLCVKPLAGQTTQCKAKCLVRMLTRVHRVRSNGRCVQLCIPKRLGVPAGFACGGCTDPSAYNISLLLAEVPSTYRQTFIDAGARWQKVIVGDIPDENTLGIRGNSNCDPYVPHTIDDILICAFIIAIDGPKQVLGYAGVEFARSGSGFPSVGYMAFDSADLQSLIDRNIFYKVILHEIGHLLGIQQSTWQSKGLTSNCEYKSATAASREWQTLTGCKNAIPVEKDGSAGTACSHWDEDCLQGELMTGYVRNGTLELSRMTVGTLQDIGYTVDFDMADAFGVEKVNSSCLAACPRRRLNDKAKDLSRNAIYTAKHRQLTDARANAIAYGKIMLETNAAKAPPTTEEGGIDDRYVAGQLISIFYLEESDGSVQSVTVVNDNN